MKKILKSLRSMKLGMILLILILICSFAGSVITQDLSNEYYIAAYPKLGHLFLGLGLDHIFSAWYFGVLSVLLCVNLIFCSVFRFGAVRNSMKTMPLAAAQAEAEPSGISPERMESYLRTNRFHLCSTTAGGVWAKNRAGHYGSFAVHLSILLLIIFAVLTLCFSVSEDVDCHVGETAELSDGTSICLHSIRFVNEAGNSDYISKLVIRDADGEITEGETSVNHAMSAAGHKFYQYGYGTAGQINTVYNGEKDRFYVTNDDSGSLFTVDEKSGILFYGLYPDYRLDEDGSVVLVTDDSGGYPNPVYSVCLISKNETKSGLAIPGDTLTAGDASFTFGEVANYSVIRATTTSPALLGCLYASFALIIAGLWLCFFQVPVYVKIDSRGYAVRSTKPTTDFELGLKSLKKEGTVGRHA